MASYATATGAGVAESGPPIGAAAWDRSRRPDATAWQPRGVALAHALDLSPPDTRCTLAGCHSCMCAFVTSVASLSLRSSVRAVCVSVAVKSGRVSGAAIRRGQFVTRAAPVSRPSTLASSARRSYSNSASSLRMMIKEQDGGGVQRAGGIYRHVQRAPPARVCESGGSVPLGGCGSGVSGHQRSVRDGGVDEDAQRRGQGHPAQRRQRLVAAADGPDGGHWKVRRGALAPLLHDREGRGGEEAERGGRHVVHRRQLGGDRAAATEATRWDRCNGVNRGEHSRVCWLRGRERAGPLPDRPSATPTPTFSTTFFPRDTPFPASTRVASAVDAGGAARSRLPRAPAPASAPAAHPGHSRAVSGACPAHRPTARSCHARSPTPPALP
eukprot:ctg_562.g267